MVEYFATVDPQTGITNYLFTQGVLGVMCVALIIVVIYQQRKLDKKDIRIEELQDLRLEDSKTREKVVSDVMNDTSQNLRILSEKIEVAKGRR